MKPNALPHFIRLLILSFILSACETTDTTSVNQATLERRALLGGVATVFDDTRDAYGRNIPDLTDDQFKDFFVGNSFFRLNWVEAPASTKNRDGLGPTLNAKSCGACHFKDGRGRAPVDENEKLTQALIRLSIPGKDKYGDTIPEPNYGGQFQPFGTSQTPGEGDIRVQWIDVPGEFGDGTPYTLRKPKLLIKELTFGPFHKDTMLSLRSAPVVYGLGLLEAIEDKTLLWMADPDDENKDGISGRVNRVWDIKKQKMVIGRFGKKAGQPTVEQQAAMAFHGDMGITSFYAPKENCPDAQRACQAANHGGEPEISDKNLRQVTFYMKALAVPARRNLDDPEALKGEELFIEAGCVKCHVSQVKTGFVQGMPQLSNQTIRPYTDLLLHDMGEGLADNRPDKEASGKEWRTPPLWGIGLTKKVNKHTNFLHDGRARNLEEAILWHGGEANEAKEFYRNLPEADRRAFIAFLQSL